jgi:hypothetical protein
MRNLIAALLLVTSAGAANAYCVAVPDDASSAYVRNNLKTTICLNSEIARNTAVQNWQVEVDAALGQLDRNFVRDKLDAIQPAVVIPNPATPAWP